MFQRDGSGVIGHEGLDSASSPVVSCCRSLFKEVVSTVCLKRIHASSKMTCVLRRLCSFPFAVYTHQWHNKGMPRLKYDDHTHFKHWQKDKERWRKLAKIVSDGDISKCIRDTMNKECNRLSVE